MWVPDWLIKTSIKESRSFVVYLEHSKVAVDLERLKLNYKSINHLMCKSYGLRIRSCLNFEIRELNTVICFSTER